MGDEAGALSDADHAVELWPYSAPVWRQHGLANMALGRWQDALTDYHHGCDLSDTRHGYEHLFIWIIQERLDQKDTANQELRDYLAHRPEVISHSWVTRVAGYLLGDLAEPDLWKAASSTHAKEEAGQHCEAWYYIGMKKLLAGDQPGAADCFRRCVGTQVFTFFEYTFATAELKKLAPWK